MNPSAPTPDTWIQLSPVPSRRSSIVADCPSRSAAEDFGKAIVVQSAALTGKLDGAGPDTFRDKVIRVTGEVTLFKDSPQIVMTMPAQLTIVEAKK